MNKDRDYIGIDVSKDLFHVNFQNGSYKVFKNNNQGFKALLPLLSDQAHCVMEQTGPYHFQLAVFLVEHKVMVSVVNALSIKRLVQMKLKITKTDKADAQMIREYAIWNAPKQWVPPADFIRQCKELRQLLTLLNKQSTQLKNQKHSFLKQEKSSRLALKIINRSINQIKRDKARIEKQMENLIAANLGDLVSKLTSIPGVGKKTAIALIVATNGFEDFQSAKQLSSFVGLAPTTRLSGSSIKGKSRISKKGDKEVRNLLFMCSFTAHKHNPGCKKIYERIVAKGKSKKLALIAVANKLLKQIIAIAKSGIVFDPAYQSTNPLFKKNRTKSLEF